MSIWDTARRQLSGLPGGLGLNMAYEAADRHVAAGDGDRVALRFLGRDGGARDMTFADLARVSNRFANILDDLGVAPGDVVFSLLGRVPELYAAALGTLKARAVFCPLFAAFGPDPIRVRIEAGRGRLLVTTTDLYRRKIASIRSALPSLADAIVVGEGRIADTLAYDSLMATAADRYAIAATDEDTPALLHFTSGTTGRPKGAVHVHGAVVAHAATGRVALDLRPGDVYWCTADPGWVTGVSYGIIAPLVLGATSIVDAGAFDPARWCGVLAEQRVAVWYSAPTAIRMLIKAGAGLASGRDYSRLRHAASVGEPLDAGAATWGERVFGVPFHDTWWQTETGAIMIANLPGEPITPGSMGRPLPDVEAAVIGRVDDGTPTMVTSADTVGELALVAGWPSMFRAYLDAPDRYARCFAAGYYLSGDLVRRDPSGRFWFVGRRDDAIKSAGHLIGPYEVERVLLAHPAIAEAGVIGVPDPLVGEAVKAFVALKSGYVADESLRRDLLALARRRLGAVVAPRDVVVVGDLPKTRSGKIMRRLLRSRELGLPDDDLSTLEPTVGGGEP